MADRIVVMQSGNIEQIGAPLELYDHPINLFVAGFIGSPAMNFIEGTIHRANGVSHVVAGDGTRFEIPSRFLGENGQRVVYGTRPEHLEIADGTDGIETDVDVVEPTGSETLVVGTMAGQTIQAAFRERHEFHPGQRIRLRPRLEHVHLFDAQNGSRLEHD